MGLSASRGDMDRWIRFLAVAVVAAAVVCAAAEPENSWHEQAADTADLFARSAPLSALAVPVRAASEVISFIDSHLEGEDVVPEDKLIEEGGAPAKAAPVKAAAVKAPVKAPVKASAKAAVVKAAVKKAPVDKKTAATKVAVKKAAAKVAKLKKGIKKVAQKKAAHKKAAPKKAAQAAIKKVEKKVGIKKGPTDHAVKALRGAAARIRKKMKETLHPVAPQPMAKKKYALPKNYPGKLHLPKHFAVPGKAQLAKRIREATPPAIHTSKEYWKLKQLRAEYRFKKGYDATKTKMLKKYLARHFASKLEMDHMRRKIDTMRRDRALDTYGPGAHYKPFTWGEYDEPADHKRTHVAEKQVSQHAAHAKKQDMLRKAGKDIKQGK